MTFTYIGWLLTIASVILVVGQVTKALIVHVWEEASELRQVSGDDAIRTLILAVWDLTGLFRQRIWATVVSVALGLTLLIKGVNGFASFGYCAFTFVIAGLATPAAIRAIRSVPNDSSATVQTSTAVD